MKKNFFDTLTSKFNHINSNTYTLIKLGLIGFVVTIPALLLNKLLYNSFLTNDLWGFISGFITSNVALIALIIFLRRIIINGIYVATFDYCTNTISQDITDSDSWLIKNFKNLIDKAFDENDTSNSNFQTLERIYMIHEFSEYLIKVGPIQSLIIKSYSLISTGEWSYDLENKIARQMNWYEKFDDISFLKNN